MENKRYRWHVIHDRIRDIPNPIGAEIGVHRGECSGHLLEMHLGLKLYMIDMWSPDTYKGKGDDAATGPYRELYQNKAVNNYHDTCNNVSKYGHRAVLMIKDSISASECFGDAELDFCFIDASHSYEDAKSDGIAWIPKIKKGGYIFFHDYGLFEGVTRAVEDLFLKIDPKSTLKWNTAIYNLIETDDDYMAVIRL